MDEQIAEKQDALEILCVGRLTPAKGQHLLIDAVERLSRSGRSVRLRLVGSGPDEASLRACAAKIAWPELVVFEGAVNQNCIRSLYEQADVFCLPSFAEGLPVVLMEAMAMGVLVRIDADCRNSRADSVTRWMVCWFRHRIWMH